MTNLSPEMLAKMNAERDALSAVFDRVRDPNDWRAPISVTES